MGSIYNKARFKLRTFIEQLNMLFTMGEELEAKVDGTGMELKTINGESLKGEGDIEVQTPLESGVNIKTINGQPITGAGDLVVGEGGTVAIDGELSTASENPVQNKVITTALNGKQDTIPAGTYATPSDVSTAIADKVTTTQLDTALADKVTTTQMNTALADKVTTTQMNTALAGKQDVLVAGTGISIVDNVISATGGATGNYVEKGFVKCRYSTGEMSDTVSNIQYLGSIIRSTLGLGHKALVILSWVQVSPITGDDGWEIQGIFDGYETVNILGWDYSGTTAHAYDIIGGCIKGGTSGVLNNKIVTINNSTDALTVFSVPSGFKVYALDLGERES